MQDGDGGKPRRWWGLAAVFLVGSGLRLAAYANDRGLWLDEVRLKKNLVQGSLWNPWSELKNSQAVPPLYLLMERWLSWLSGGSNLVIRLPSLGASLAALGLMWAVGRRALPERSALVPLLLLALSPEQVYFSTELKPYGIDLTIGLALVWAALKATDAGLTARWMLALAAMGSVSVWFSFTSVFVLAGVGVWVAAGEIRARRWRRLPGLMAVGAVWLASFGGALLASRTQMGEHRDLWEFWEIAFLPSVWDDWLSVPRRLMFLFVCPLDFHAVDPVGSKEWFDSRLVAIPAIGSSMVGLVWLGQHRARVLGLLGLLLAFTLMASWLHCYPFHGRLVMFLVPALLLTIAAGVEMLWSRAGKWAAAVLVVVLIAPMLWTNMYWLAVSNRMRRASIPWETGGRAGCYRIISSPDR